MKDLAPKDVHEATAKVAYELWEHRGRPIGSAEEDWFAAQQILAAPKSALKAKPTQAPPTKIRR